MLVGPAESEFVLDWTPRVLRPGVTLTMDISMKTSWYLALSVIMLIVKFFLWLNSM